MSVQNQSNSEYRFVHEFYDAILEIEGDWVKASELSEKVNLSKQSISKNLSYIAGREDSPLRKEKIEASMAYSYETEQELQNFRDRLEEERPWEEANTGFDHEYFAEEVAEENRGEELEELDLQVRIANRILDGDRIDVNSKSRLHHTGKVTEELRDLESVKVDEDRIYYFEEA